MRKTSLSNNIKIIALVLTSVLGYSFSGMCQPSVQSFDEKKIFAYIKNELSKEYQLIDSLIIVKATTGFSFHFGDFLQDVIADQYIEDFSFAKTKLTEKTKTIIDRISDSLKSETDRINTLCIIPDNSAYKLKRSENMFYLFFSPFCENKLYVTVFHSQGIMIFNKKYHFQGTAHTYLFFLEGDEINKIYKGLISYD